MPIELNDIAGFVAKLLNESGVKYAIVGGVAAGVMGRSRATSDVDILLKAKASEVDEFLDIIESLGLKMMVIRLLPTTPTGGRIQGSSLRMRDASCVLGGGLSR